MPNDVEILADAFLSCITEDETGIWELADEVAHQLPSESPESRLVRAQAALDLLLTKEFVIASRGPAFGNVVRLDIGEARAAIVVPEMWSSPELTNKDTLMLDSTEAGDSFYFSGSKLATNEPT